MCDAYAKCWTSKGDSHLNNPELQLWFHHLSGYGERIPEHA